MSTKHSLGNLYSINAAGKFGKFFSEVYPTELELMVDVRQSVSNFGHSHVGGNIFLKVTLQKSFNFISIV